jgi:hypothetical protein
MPTTMRGLNKDEVPPLLHSRQGTPPAAASSSRAMITDAWISQAPTAPSQRCRVRVSRRQSTSSCCSPRPSVVVPSASRTPPATSPWRLRVPSARAASSAYARARSVPTTTPSSSPAATSPPTPRPRQAHNSGAGHARSWHSGRHQGSACAGAGPRADRPQRHARVCRPPGRRRPGGSSRPAQARVPRSGRPGGGARPRAVRPQDDRRAQVSQVIFHPCLILPIMVFSPRLLYALASASLSFLRLVCLRITLLCSLLSHVLISVPHSLCSFLM